MDHFGIGAAIKGAAEIYFRSARRTGRTTRFIDTLKNGDRVLTASKDERRHLQDLLRERGLQVEVILREPRQFRYEPEPPNPLGRTLMAHDFVEQCYRLALEDEEKNLRRWHEVHNPEPLEGEAAQFVALEHSKWRVD